jgi:glutamine synthetase
MAKYKLEYIWLDGYTPVANLRGKTLIKEFESFPSLESLPAWGFDGSSTQQAEGGSSDCVLKPVAVYPDTTRRNGAIVMCEVMMPDGTPHPSNARATILDDPGAWFGFEQEYFLYQDGRPLGFPADGFPKIGQGPYYCGVGYKFMGDIARQIVEEHLDLCFDAGINHEGINAEVAKGQWEFQIFGKGSKKPPTKCGSPAIFSTRLRKIRHRRRIPLQTSRRQRLERIRHARELLHRLPA